MSAGEVAEDIELELRTLDSILIGYNSRSFPIPPEYDIIVGVGDALREMLGEKEASFHWEDTLKWPTIDNKYEIPGKIKNGLKILLGKQGRSDPMIYQHMFWESSYFRDNLEWFFNRGNRFRFKDGKRQEAVARSLGFWNQKETDFFQEMHCYLDD